ncbi:MAG TPA: tripartite tricarboxylate transporter substrate-binding protein, partial [Chondromyces sp.]|nr:tripartite tricarboxylate transporter substrate-binding protein [Chondromyces sp.]
MRGLFKKAFVGATLIGLFAAAGCSATVDEETAKSASGYPEKPIEIIVPAGAGGDTDLNTRIMAKHLEKELGTSVIVSNVTGAGGTTGTQKVMDSKADGYTALAFHNSMLLNNIYGLANYTYSDFKIAGISVVDRSNTFVTTKDSKFKDIKSLIEYAKKNPKKVTVATEVGSMTYIQMLQFQQQAGVEFNIVDVGGASDKITALLGGR